MEIVVIDVEKREDTGTRACRRLRRGDRVPAVVYGLGGKAESLAVSRGAITDALRGGAHLLELQMGEKKEPVLVKDVQFDHLGDEVLHVDFVRVERGKKLSVTVPVEFDGHARGVLDGGVLEHLVTDLEVECLPRHIPERIVVDVSSLGIGEHLSLKDLELPEGVETTGDPEQAVVTVTVKGAAAGPAEELPAEEAAGEPEIIGKKEEDEDEAKSS